MTKFDKVCAVLAIPLGFVLMFLGVFGLFAGSSAHFTLPPVLGVVPFFVGWAMSVTLIRFWKKYPAAEQHYEPEYQSGQQMEWPDDETDARPEDDNPYQSPYGR